MRGKKRVDKIIQYFPHSPSVSAKVGGWLNLVIGASVLSFLELIYFVGALLYGCISKRQKIF
jgi:hypothetical protein